MQLDTPSEQTHSPNIDWGDFDFSSIFLTSQMLDGAAKVKTEIHDRYFVLT